MIKVLNRTLGVSFRVWDGEEGCMAVKEARVQMKQLLYCEP